MVGNRTCMVREVFKEVVKKAGGRGRKIGLLSYWELGTSEILNDEF